MYFVVPNRTGVFLATVIMCWGVIVNECHCNDTHVTAMWNTGRIERKKKKRENVQS